MNKVYGGTPNHSGESRCITCRHAIIYRGLADSSERTNCSILPNGQPRQPVIECNSYDDKRHPSRWDMEQIAWVLVTNKVGKAIGFVSAKDAQRIRDEGGDCEAPTTPGFGG